MTKETPPPVMARFEKHKAANRKKSEEEKKKLKQRVVSARGLYAQTDALMELLGD